MRNAALDQHERGQQDHPSYQQDDRRRRAPPLGLGLRQPVDHAHQPGHDQDRAGRVKVHLCVAGLVRQQPHRARDGDQGQDDVDIQAPPPAQVLGQQPAQQQPHRAAGAGDRAVDPERLTPFGRVGEGHRQRRQRRRCQQGAERALNGAAGHQHAEARRRAAERGGGGEARQADDQHPAPANQVRQPAAEQQQTAERQGVRGHHPLPVGV